MASLAMEYDETLSPANEKLKAEQEKKLQSIDVDKPVPIQQQKSEAPQSNNSSTNSVQSILNNANLSDIERWKQLILSILRNTLCYYLMPESGKVVVFDSSLPVKHAFRALAEHDIKCAPVWQSSTDESESKFMGFMTVTDFAHILHFYAQDQNSFNRNVGELERGTVGRWCTFRKQHKQTQITRKFVSAKPDEPIFNAVFRMHQYFIHRMPVRHSQSILCILNHQAILRYVLKKSNRYNNLFDIKVKDLFEDEDEYKTDAPTLTDDQPVSEVITLLSTNRRCSAIPLCDNGGIVHDAFMRSDIRVYISSHSFSLMKLFVCLFCFL